MMGNARRIGPRGAMRSATSRAFAISLAVGGLSTLANATGSPGCPADFDQDGSVAHVDLVILLRSWDTPTCDLDGDGTTGASDLAALLAAWGPCPEGFVCGEGSVIALAPDGTFTMPDWSGAESARPFLVGEEDAEGNPIIVTTEPIAGTVFVGPQSVIVGVSAGSEGGEIGSCSIELTLVDATPPAVDVRGVADGQLFTAGSVVTPRVTVSDSVTPTRDITLTAFLDGAAWNPRTPIMAPGYHTLEVFATDGSGNIGSVAPIDFQILEFPLLSGLMVVSQQECSGPEGAAWLDTTILFGTDQFDETQIDMDSVVLWPLNENGALLSHEPIFVANSTTPTGFYSYASAEAEYQEGYWTIHFQTPRSPSESNLDACAVAYRLTGSVDRGLPTRFDFEATTPATVVEQPLRLFAAAGLLNADPPKGPKAQPACPPCEWKEKRDPGAKDTVNTSDTIGCIGGKPYWKMNVTADGGKISGEAKAFDECAFVADPVKDSSVNSSMMITVSLIGRRACCDPTIECTFKPKFKAKVKIDPPAEALAAGVIDIASDCNAGATRAIGAIQNADIPPISVNFGGSASVGDKGPSGGVSMGVTATLAQGDNEGEDTYIGNAVPTCNQAQVRVSIVTVARLKVKATSSFINWTGQADAWLRDATPGVTIEAKCSAESPCGALTKKVEYK
ncbi:MAG: hypothetical protein JNL80_14310 [Phycisphaerae bacterium]|nr:hypothetical protein [Phycisphaerae bacterium]